MSKLTTYQVELMGHLKAGSPAGDGPIDFDQLLAALSWTPTKAAAHFSIRALTRRGLIRKQEALTLRRGRRRVCFELTEQGRLALDPRPGLVEPEIRMMPESAPAALDEKDESMSKLLLSIETCLEVEAEPQIEVLEG